MKFLTPTSDLLARTAVQRAVLYLRVAAAVQPDADFSILEQRCGADAYCQTREWQIVAEFVDLGAASTDDRRPEFRRLMEAAVVKPRQFDIVLVESFSRFSRDFLVLEHSIACLAECGIRLVSTTQGAAERFDVSSGVRQLMSEYPRTAVCSQKRGG